MTTIEQLAAVVQQTVQHINQCADAMHQFVQVHQPQMAGAAVGTTTKVLDMRYLKYTIFEGVSSKYDDWAFTFNQVIRSVNCDAYDLLVHVER